MTGLNTELTSADGQAFGAYLVRPDSPNGGAVVVLQEIFGINANIRAVANDLAAAGYLVIAPDLFWRQQPGIELDPSKDSDRERATALLQGLDIPLAVSDAMAAANVVRALPGASGKVGAVGYCLGGKLAYLLAAQPGIAAAVSYYGVAIQASLDKVAELKAPLLLHIAEEDHLCPPEAQKAIADAIAGSSLVEIMSYPGVGHAFARRGGATLDPPSANRADSATMAFLARYLA